MEMRGLRMREVVTYGRTARFMPIGALLVLLVLILSGCGADSLSATQVADVGGTADADEPRAIVIGNVDANNPARKIEEFQPLADYLVAHLGASGVTEGRVVIATDTAEMARMLASEEVDFYIDATIPTLEVCSTAGCELVLRQWKGGEAELAGVFVTIRDGDIVSLDDLRGHVIMLEQPHSTVGHILPLVALAEQGIPTRRVRDLQTPVASDEVGYYVSSGGQSSMSFLLDGDIVALAIGERAFERFSPEVQAQVVIFERTIAAPSQLVAVRPGFDPELQAEIFRLMLALEHSDEGQEILEALRDTVRFDEMPSGAMEFLDELYEAVQNVNQN